MKIYTNDLIKGHSDFKVKCSMTFGLYTQVSDSGPLGPLVYYESVLQIRRSNRGNLGIISHISPCNPSLEPSWRDGSNEGSQHMFSLRNKKCL